MKAVAAALVLIAGAAVVLWYGDTLNSWVLGGLIGGLAALLLSIPISLTLFSYLSRRHDEGLRAEAEEESAQAYHYAQISARAARSAYEIESYALPARALEEVDDDYRGYSATRNLPVPSSPRLPVAQPQSGRLSGRLPASQRGAYVPTQKQPGKGTSGRRTTGRRLNYPGFPGYEPHGSYTRHRSAALRAARREATQQYDDVDEIMPTSFPRRLPPSIRASQELAQQEGLQRPSRPLEQRSPGQYKYRTRRSVDAAPSQGGMEQSLPAEGESSASRASQRYRRDEPHTDYLDDNFPQTESLASQRRTGDIARRSQMQRQRPDMDFTTDDLQRPLVRRAPYTYEDDALRQELSRQIDAPIVRRSSLFEEYEQEDDEEAYD